MPDSIFFFLHWPTLAYYSVSVLLQLKFTARMEKWVSLAAWQRPHFSKYPTSRQQFDKCCSSSTATKPEDGFSLYSSQTLYSSRSLERMPLLWANAWLVTDKEKGVILLKHAIWVPRSMGYLNVESDITQCQSGNACSLVGQSVVTWKWPLYRVDSRLLLVLKRLSRT